MEPELGGVVVIVTVVGVDVGTDVTLVDAVALVDVELDVLCDTDPLVSVVDVDADVLSDVVVDADVVDVAEVVVACGSLASILTSACCTRLASSAFC
ncbi:Uncharacterised protein [Mycobacteroides abscessus subsp. abscessus]|nr:Uncharacterised protein [Mycobacteroides abscessus subsp. abscessus]